MTITQVNGELWFVRADVCKVLGLPNVGDAKARLDQQDVGTTDVQNSRGQMRQTVCVSESGLYDVILDSRKPEALQNTPAEPS